MDAVEREAKLAGRDARRRGEVRKEQSEQTSAGIRALPDELSPQALPRCELGRAIGYANNQRNALERFVADGEIDIPGPNAGGMTPPSAAETRSMPAAPKAERAKRSGIR